MSQPPTRRRLLKLAAGAAAAAPLVSATPSAYADATGPVPPAVPVRAAAAAVPAPPTWAVRPFPLDQVTLGDGVFRRKRDLMNAPPAARSPPSTSSATPSPSTRGKRRPDRKT
jgi:hypothetical protein